jgi:hypothetical protein
VKLMQTQRDSAFEKAHKLSQLAELITKADSLDSEYAAKLAAIDEHVQARKRRQYQLGKQRRLAQLQSETRAGFLQSQVVGWDSEFARLQEFTGMDKRFAPGDEQTIDEITTRYLSKDQQNTSLLRYLHAQQVEVQSLEGEMKSTHATAKTLERQLQVRRRGARGRGARVYGEGWRGESTLVAYRLGCGCVTVCRWACLQRLAMRQAVSHASSS